MKEVTVKTKSVQTRILNQVAEKVRKAVNHFTDKPIVENGENVPGSYWKTVIVRPDPKSDMLTIVELNDILDAVEEFRDKYAAYCYVVIKGMKVMQVGSYERIVPFVEINLRRDVAKLKY